MHCVPLPRVKPSHIRRTQRAGCGTGAEVVNVRITPAGSALEHEPGAPALIHLYKSGAQSNLLHITAYLPTKRISSHPGEIAHCMTQTCEAHGHVKFRPGDGGSKVLDLVQSALFLGDEQAHGLADGQNALAHGYTPE